MWGELEWKGERAEKQLNVEPLPVSCVDIFGMNRRRGSGEPDMTYPFLPAVEPDADDRHSPFTLWTQPLTPIIKGLLS